MKQYQITADQLLKLADGISNMDGCSSLSERNRSAQAAHEIIEEVLGDDAGQVYGIDDTDPVEQFRIESQLKSDSIVHINADLAKSQLDDARKPEGGLLQRLKNELLEMSRKLNRA